MCCRPVEDHCSDYQVRTVAQSIQCYCIYNELRRFDAIFLGLPERKFLACTVHVKDRHSMCDSFNIKILNYLHQK